MKDVTQSLDAAAKVLQWFQSASDEVPAYRAFLARHGVRPEGVCDLAAFRALPVMTKQNYHQEYALPQLCRGGRLERADLLAVSSGSTGSPTVWPRTQADEAGTVARFEQVLCDGFRASRRRTLAVVCFALGSWVGGMYTTSACRQLAGRGHPITTVTPGNNVAEILRVVRALGDEFDQVVLLGYPPFLRDVLEAGVAAGVDWKRWQVRLVVAGEVFSEAWRDLVCARLGATEPEFTTASLYGTADGGVLANETPLSIRVRRALGEHPDLGLRVFGEARLPTLCQFDPGHRYFEVEAGHLVFSGDGLVPLLRYAILDRGGVIGYDQMLTCLSDAGVQLSVPEGAPKLPFVFVFGRSNFAVSYYGANVFPENVAIGVERGEFADSLTGKFVLEVAADEGLRPYLRVSVELGRGVQPHAELTDSLAEAVEQALCSVNSEFGNYVPSSERRPRVVLLPFGEPNYFPPGVKHRYTRH